MSLPSAPAAAPTYTGITATSVTLNNVPGLGAASTGATTPISVSVEGAGYAPANGDYLPVTGANATLNGQPQYTNGSCSMYYYQTYWSIDSGRAVTAPSNFADGSAGYLYAPDSTPGLTDGAFPPAGTSWTNLGDYGPGDGSSPPTAVTPDYGSEATSLNIQRALDSGFTTGLVTFTGVTPSTNYVDSTVAPGADYFYRYVGVNADGSAPGPASSVMAGSSQGSLSASYALLTDAATVTLPHARGRRAASDALLTDSASTTMPPSSFRGARGGADALLTDAAAATSSVGSKGTRHAYDAMLTDAASTSPTRGFRGMAAASDALLTDSATAAETRGIVGVLGVNGQNRVNLATFLIQ